VTSSALVKSGEAALPAVVYSQVYDVCEAVAFGADLEEACQRPGFPSKDLFIGWMMRDPQVALVYQRAREVSAYALEDEALALLRSRVRNPKSALDLRAADLLVQQIRWAAAKRNPQVFSEKSAVNVTVPIQINTSLDMGKGGGAGTAEFPNIYEMKAAVVREIETPADPETPVLEGGALKKRPKPRRGGPQKRVLIPKSDDEMLAIRKARSEAYRRRAATIAAKRAAREALIQERERASGA
jgi:hypothetical protein